MLILPAVFLGGIVAAAVVFYLGYLITSTILNWIAHRRKTASGPSAARLPIILEEDSIAKLSLVGGVLAIGLVVLLLFSIQEDLTLIAWIVLTILGILAGFLSFLLVDTRGAPPAAAGRAGEPGSAPPSQAKKEVRSQARDEPTIIVPCERCAQKLRIPRRGRRLIITCPKCGHSFPYGPDRVPLVQALRRNIRSLWKKLRPE
jgi:ribosomal protein L37AE/L43A